METLIISGKSQAGKDQMAQMMKSKLESVGCNCLIIHFADLVKTDFWYKSYESNIPRLLERGCR